MISPPESGACPVCAAPVAADVLHAPWPRPVLNNQLYDALDDALACPAGRIELVQCGTCAFIFNRAFDETLVAYSQSHDSTRSHSPAYLAHLDALVSLIAPRIPRGARALELGCGDGAFLSRLQTATGAECHGHDNNAPEAAGTKTLRFHRGRLEPSGVTRRAAALRSYRGNRAVQRCELRRAAVPEPQERSGRSESVARTAPRFVWSASPPSAVRRSGWRAETGTATRVIQRQGRV